MVARVMVVLWCVAANVSGQTPPNVKPDEFKKRREKPEAVILDVRSAAEFTAEHFDGAINLDVNDATFREKAAKLNKEKEYLVHCQGGRRGSRACQILSDLGFKNVVNLDGGLRAYKQAGHPLRAQVGKASESASGGSRQTSESGFTQIFDGKSLAGWHVSAKSGHSRTSKNKSGGRWVVEGGAIVGSQDVPGNGGIVITDEQFGDFEVALEMNNDFGPDSGLFLRSTEDGKAWQAMIDYHPKGNVMGIYGEGLGGKPHVRNYSFTDKVTEIVASDAPTPLPIKPQDWPNFWRHGQWNELRARIVGNPPKIETWINGVKFMEWTETTKRHPDRGGIALQVHGGGDHTKEFVRYRNIRVKRLTK